VLRKHLDWRLSVSMRTRLLAMPEVGDLVTELLADHGSAPRRARDLAGILSEEINEDGLVDLGRVRARMARQEADDLDMWFRSLQDLPTRCHAIALAVLDGLPTEYVAEASARLYRILRSELPSVFLTNEVLVPRAADPFGTSRETRLRRLRARARDGVYWGATGHTPAEVEEYVDPAYVPGVLQRAWRQYEIQAHLLEWLGWLVEHDSGVVRARSAYAVGVLADLAFDQVQQQALVPWAGSDSARRRDAAAIALQYPAANPELRFNVRRLIRRWYTNKAVPRLQATAALAFGYSFGVLQPDAALEHLERLALVDNAEVALAVGRALGYLLLEHDTAVATDVFVALVRWLDDRERLLTGELAFLVLAMLWIDEDPEAPRPRVDMWPALLELADREPTLRGSLAYLWHRVLSGGHFPDAAARILEDYWAINVEADELACTVFGRMALAAAEGRERTRRVLLRAADEWTEPRNLRPKPKAAAAVRAVLGGTRGAWES
jgi:hypothetical protein